MKVKSIERLIAKYESDIQSEVVMDDYDGGMMTQKKVILKELKKLKKHLDKVEKSGIV